ncbi:delta-60 repeat domain-containing protein [Aquimonas voraii]|uniref:Delta-60 repeat domain-containing protein n=1 Tax=Aquimonas voraii TaxID=265719 RepID=A0A1G6XBY1_9GAMM|nr:delta-60 repeat domain-containing protein [Aquimonas voraii]SDD74785.1 delta-60 repeat domain-containing protein [Aquimonas voraii]
MNLALRVLLRLTLSSLPLAALLPATAQAQFDPEGVQYLSPFGEANNALGAALAVHADGSYTVAGTAIQRGEVAPVYLLARRVAANGSPDPSFNFSLQHGAAINLGARSLLALPDGGVLLAYTLANPDSPSDSFTRVVKLDADGDPAPGFTPFVFDPTLGADEAHTLALQADGRILMAGSQPSLNGGGERLAVALRLDPNGSLDTSFASDGFFRQPGLPSPNQFQTFLPEPAFSGIGLLADGRIQLVGTASNFLTGQSELLMRRLRADGSVDPDFNGGEPRLYAHRRASNTGLRTVGSAADVSPEGVILVGGFSTAGGSNAPYLWQFDGNGQLMASASEELDNFHTVRDVQLLPNAGAVAVGSYTDASVSGALVAVYPQGVGFSGGFFGRFASSARDHSLSALAYLPDSAQLLGFGTGITEIGGLFSNRWVLTLDALPALDLLPSLPPTLRFEGVAPGAMVDSGALSLPGVSDFVRVPLRVRAGTLEVGGVDVDSPDETSPRLLWANSGGSPAALSLRLRHTAAPTLGVETVTRLQAGGVVRSHNHALTVGAIGELRMESLTGQGKAVFADGFEVEASPVAD